MEFEITLLGATKVTVNIVIEQYVDIVIPLDSALKCPGLDSLTKLADPRIKWLAKPFYSVGSNVARDFDVTVSFHRD